MKIINKQPIAFIKNLTKAYTEGIYADTPANRKLGRVGMSYAAYAEKIKGEEKKESNKEDEEDIKFDLVEAERGIYDLYPNPIELKSVSSYVKKVSAKDSKSGSIEYEVFLEFKNGNKIDSKSERLNNQSEVKKWIKEKIKKERNEGEIKILVDKTETLKNAEGKRLDAIIKYSNSGEEEGVEGIKVAKDATDNEKKLAIAKFYKEAAEGDAENLDEIIEDALADYVPEEKD